MGTRVDMTALEKARLVHDLVNEMKLLRFTAQTEWVWQGLMTEEELAFYEAAQEIRDIANRAGTEAGALARTAAANDIDYPPEYAELLERSRDLKDLVGQSAIYERMLGDLINGDVAAHISVADYLGVADAAKILLDRLRAEVGRNALLDELGKVARSLKAKSRKGTRVYSLHTERYERVTAEERKAADAARAAVLSVHREAMARGRAAEDARASRIEERWAASKKQVLEILGKENDGTEPS